MTEALLVIGFVVAVLASALYFTVRENQKNPPMPVLTLSTPFILMVGNEATAMRFDGWQVDYPSGDVTATARRNSWDGGA